MRRIVLGVGTIALGVLLLAMAVPRLMANLALQPGNTAGRAVFAGGLLSAPSYERLLSSRRAALEWVELPEARLELGGALYRMAQSADELHVDVEPTLREAAADIERGLTEAPVDAYAWLWLADIDQYLGDHARAAKALGLSIASAPNDPNVAPQRTALALRLWSDLDAPARGLASADARRTLAGSAARSFVRNMAETDRLAPLRQAVADDDVAASTLWLLLRHDAATG